MANKDFTEKFEQSACALLSLITGIIVTFLAFEGPLINKHIIYKTNPLIVNQILAQDVVNLIIGPLLCLGGLILFFNKKKGLDIVMLMPVYLIYYALSFGLGFEWSSNTHTGNNEKYAFYFLTVLVSGVLLMFYSLSAYPKYKKAYFKKTGLIIYSSLFILFISLFSLMWLKEVFMVTSGKELLSYTTAPTLFWVIRYFDLGFTIPLGYLGVYFLWTRANHTYTIQMLFYGFFLSMITVVNIMGLIMYINHDPQTSKPLLFVFGTLFLIVLSGYFYIKKNYR